MMPQAGPSTPPNDGSPAGSWRGRPLGPHKGLQKAPPSVVGVGHSVVGPQKGPQNRRALKRAPLSSRRRSFRRTCSAPGRRGRCCPPRTTRRPRLHSIVFNAKLERASSGQPRRLKSHWRMLHIQTRRPRLRSIVFTELERASGKCGRLRRLKRWLAHAAYTYYTYLCYS